MKNRISHHFHAAKGGWTILSAALTRMFDVRSLPITHYALRITDHASRLAKALGLLAPLLLLAALPAHAQWLTQTNTLKAGWNAVYLHVDPSYDTLDNMVGSDLSNPILEVWLWNPPASTMQFVQSPQQPVAGDQWVSWVRNSTDPQTLQRLVGNATYLVRVATGVATYAWQIKGRPLPPSYTWTTTGLNFLGFPTVAYNPPTFDAFLSKVPDLQQNAEIYYYPGGDLGTGNPARVYAMRAMTVKRGQAYWIRAGTVYNRYFAPFELALTGSGGVNYGDSINAMSFRVRNLTSTNLNVTLKLVASEGPPAGQTNIVGTPPLMVRGPLNTTNLTYAYSNLSIGGVYTWALAAKGQPGSEVEVVLGLDRTTLSGAVGALFAGVLRLTDSFGYSQVDVPVTANVASSAGLWVGAAAVTQVGQYLKTYQRDTNDNPVMDTNGQYQVTSLNTNLGAVSRTFPLRLIVHNPEAGHGNAVLLQRVFVGLDAWTNEVVALAQSSLSSTFLSQARRISAAHLPWTPTNQAWAFNGALGQSGQLAATVTLPFDDQASNPFLHTYHPDHDNLDPAFRNELAQGSESYTVRRDIRLTIVPPTGGSATFTTGAQSLSGNYAETVTMSGLARAGGTNDTRTFEVRGLFNLNRISAVPTLTSP
ncbi:MAG: hypothetical protein NTW03_04000 [Verrucomicrobia bacterium]|nr:hypothetical protein [Verrucomicrobiota bacterium]